MRKDIKKQKCVCVYKRINKSKRSLLHNTNKHVSRKQTIKNGKCV